jgi:hypothetical protein
MRNHRNKRSRQRQASEYVLRDKKNQYRVLVKSIGQFPSTANKKLLPLLSRRNEEIKAFRFAFYNSSYGILVTRQRFPIEKRNLT